MHAIWKDVLTALVMGLLVPGVVLNAAAMVMNQSPPEPVETVEVAEPVKIYPMRFQTEEGRVEVKNMDAYLVGAVLAEMPASFEMEALKAQAVAARTYTQKAYALGGKHGNNAVCPDPGCCQAYIEPEDYLARGGTLADLSRVREAVEATRGEILTYEGELIEATYFSCSGGSTEDAAAVWGTEYPYLQAVPSPGEEDATHYSDTVVFTAEEFAAALEADLKGTPDTWFGEVTYTEGGGVKFMEIGGRAYSGTHLRTLLNLRSTAFTVDPGESLVTVTTKGWGHRVGMSQYGADAMAVTGSTYREILAHYYPGTEISTIP